MTMFNVNNDANDNNKCKKCSICGKVLKEGEGHHVVFDCVGLESLEQLRKMCCCAKCLNKVNNGPVSP